MDYKENVKDYFETNAEAWMIDAYEEGGYNYPTPQHRLRIVNAIFNDRKNIQRVLDLGCGGGTTTIELAKRGLNMVGVDQSDTMLDYARNQLANEPDSVKDNVVFLKSSIEELQQKGFDAVMTMGVIGYMPDDDSLFKVVSNVLDTGGYYVVSFRNRLFNLFSVSSRTVKEANSSDFETLVNEANELYQQSSYDEIKQFINSLHQITGQILQENWIDTPAQTPSAAKGKSYDTGIEARQTTPGEAAATAEKNGFVLEQMYGVHPHISVPGLNNLLPPTIYNRLSDSLIPLEKKPISLLWSSVFIGVFRKV